MTQLTKIHVAAAFVVLALAVPCHAQTTPTADASVVGLLADKPDTTGIAIRPFRINVPEAALVDLRRRVVATRWPDRETVTDQSQGVQLAKLQELVRYWGTDYDWRKVEAKLNALPQFVTEIDGLDIHFIHVRSRHPNALPLHHHPRLAGLGPGAPEGHRPAHRSHRPRRTRGGRLRCRHPLDARLRLLGQADRAPAGVPTASRAPGPC